MKILIVDDDPNTVQMIEDAITWENYGIDQVLTAYHGRMAAEIIRREHPDIVVSDIEMPQMDGLAMLEDLASSGLELPEIVFLTCHENFTFAQKAMRYGVSAYLLKPFRAEELTAVISTSVAKCMQKKKQEEAWEELRRSTMQRERSRDYLVRTFLQNLLHRNITGDTETLAEAAARRGVPFDVRKPCYLVLAGIMLDDEDNRKYSDTELHFILKNIASEVMYGDTGAHLLIDEENPPYYLMIMPVRQENMTEKALEERGRQLAAVVEQYIQMNLCCIMTRAVYPEAFGEKYRELRERFAREGTLKAMAIWQDQEFCPGQYGTALSPEEISRFLLERKKIELVVYIRGRMKSLEEQGTLSTDSMVAIRRELLQTVYSCLRESGMQTDNMFNDDTFRLLFDRAVYTQADMIRLAGYLYDCTVKELDVLKNADSLTGRIRKYIDTHLAEPIGREEIAEFAHISPNYLSKIFREETGMSLRDYVNQKRIDEAKRLMSVTGMNVTDTALQVGFENVSYFSTVFRKYCGVTPSEWQSALGKGKER